MTKQYPKFKFVEAHMVEAKVGNYIVPAGWRIGQCLASSAWDKADFYLPTGMMVVKEIATNIYITGRKFIWKNGERWVKVKIEFVGDDEPNTHMFGEMLCHFAY